MRNTTSLVFLLGLAATLITACSDEPAANTEKAFRIATIPGDRWYAQSQVARGNVLYQANCALCHKPDASGTVEWKKLDANNKLPPPPLNGSAHTWHHPLSVLRRTVRDGGIPLGGSMPPFGAKLTPPQIDDILAYVQSHWPQEIYNAWNQRNSLASKKTRE
jgi:mono/diheme cytochrome c family protein